MKIRLAVSCDDPRRHSQLAAVHQAELLGENDPPELGDAFLALDYSPRAVADLEQILERKKHLLLAASGWIDREVVQSLSEAAKRSRVQFAILNPDRFLPSRKVIEQRLEEGKLGVPGLIRLHRWQARGEDDRRIDPQLPDPLLRDLELITATMQSLPNLVYACGARGEKNSMESLGQLFQIHLGYASGGMALLDYTDRLPPGDDYVSLSLIGSSGAAYSDDHDQTQLVYSGGRAQALPVSESDLQWPGIVQHFVDGIRAGSDWTSTITSWLRTWTIADAIGESLAKKQPVAIRMD